MANPYIPGISSPDGWSMVSDNPRARNFMQVATQHMVYLQIATFDNGYLLSVDQGPTKLCIGAESIEDGVRAVLTHLVTQGLEK